jgi:hypothetical protein
LPATFVAPWPRLTPGDLLAEAPSLYSRSLAFLVQEGENKYALKPAQRLPEAFDIAKFAQANARDGAVEDEMGNAVGARRVGIVLSHGCEIDKNELGDKHYVQTALVRPLQAVHEEHRDDIRSNRAKRAFYLPETEHLEGEHFADLRRITTMRREEVAQQLNRLASLNEDGQHELQAQLFKFFTRRKLPPEWTSWIEDTE